VTVFFVIALVLIIVAYALGWHGCASRDKEKIKVGEEKMKRIKNNSVNIQKT